MAPGCGRGAGGDVRPAPGRFTSLKRERTHSMSERPRLLVLDLLETYAREGDIDVRLERRNDRRDWICMLKSGDDRDGIRARGQSARAAITSALQQAGVEVPL